MCKLFFKIALKLRDILFKIKMHGPYITYLIWGGFFDNNDQEGTVSYARLKTWGRISLFV